MNRCIHSSKKKTHCSTHQCLVGYFVFNGFLYSLGILNSDFFVNPFTRLKIEYFFYCFLCNKYTSHYPGISVVFDNVLTGLY